MTELTVYEAHLELKKIVSRSTPARKSNDALGIQTARDELSTFLLDAGALESKLYHIFTAAERTCEECLEDTSVQIRESGVKTTDALTKTRARIECRKLLRELASAKANHKTMVTMISRADQILHAMASGISLSK